MKNRSTAYILIALVFIIVSVVLAIFEVKKTNSADKNTKGETNSNGVLNEQTKNAGDVIIAVLPVKFGNKFDFEFQLNTHTTELVYKLEDIASLKSDNGETLTPTEWEGDAPGGHHRKGTLFFPNFKSVPKSISLNIENIENNNLEFSWIL